MIVTSTKSFETFEWKSPSPLEQIEITKNIAIVDQMCYIYIYVGYVVKIIHLEVMVNDGLLWIYKNNFMANEILMILWYCIYIWQ